MDVMSVGIHEFEEKLAAHALDNGPAVAITRDGDTVGYFIPARRRRTEERFEELERAAKRLGDTLEALGLTEDEVVEDFKRWRARNSR